MSGWVKCVEAARVNSVGFRYVILAEVGSELYEKRGQNHSTTLALVAENTRVTEVVVLFGWLGRLPQLVFLPVPVSVP